MPKPNRIEKIYRKGQSRKSNAVTCEGKDAFPTKAAALERLLALRKGHLLSCSDPRTIDAYYCYHCGMWHIGHRPKNKKMR